MAYSPMELATVFIKTGELEDALAALDEHLVAETDDDTARRLRANVLMRLRREGELEQALSDIQALSLLTLDDHVRKSIILEYMGRQEDAVQSMRDAYQLAPDDARVVERYVKLLVAVRQFDDALKLIKEQTDDWQWAQWAGDIHIKQDDDASAVAGYSQALKQLGEQFDVADNRHAAAMQARLLLARGHAYRRLNQLQAAEADYLSAQAIQPDDPSIGFNLGLLKALAGDTTGALQLCREAIHDAPETLRQAMLESLDADERYSELKAGLGDVR